MLKRQGYRSVNSLKLCARENVPYKPKAGCVVKRNRLRCAPTLRAAAIASLTGLLLALANIPAHAQTRDDKAARVDIGARGGLAKQTPASSVAPSDGQESSVEFSARAGIATEYMYRGTTLSAHQPAIGAVFEAAFNHFYAGASVTSVSSPASRRLRSR